MNNENKKDNVIGIGHNQNEYSKNPSAKPKSDGDFFPKQATPRMIGDLAEKLELQRQMTGGESTWNTMKATAKTPQEKNEIREIIRENYKKNGAKNMDPDDLKWIGKGKIQNEIKIDVSGISSSINNYINATRANAPAPPPKKQRDPDLDLGLASLIGGSNEF